MGLAVAAGPWSRGPIGGQAGAGVDPMRMMNEALSIRQTQQQWEAAQRAGQLMAAAPDGTTALQWMQRDPLGPFMIPMMEAQSQMNLQAQHIKQSEAITGKTNLDTAHNAANYVFRANINSPDNLQADMDAQFAALDPAVRAEGQPVVNDIIHHMLDGLPTGDPRQRLAEYQRRVMGPVVGGGMSSPDYTAITLGGLPRTETVGGQPTGGVIGIGGGGAITYPGITPGEPGSRIPGLIPGQAPSAPITAPGGDGGAPAETPAPAPVTAPAGSTTGGYTGNEPSTVQFQQHPQTGYPMMNPAQEATAKDLNKEYNDKETPAYQDALQMQGALGRMSDAYTNLARGGFQVAGPSATFRNEIAALDNTWRNILGEPPDFDPSKVTSAMEFNKEAERLRDQVTNQFFGAGRHAAQTIENVGKAVPSLENTPMAGQAIIASLQAAAQYNIDLHNFKNAWRGDPRRGYSLEGADTAFTSKYKPEDYAAKYMGRIGLTPGGAFINKQAVVSAMNKGWLSQQEAAKVLHDEFKVNYWQGQTDHTAGATRPEPPTVPAPTAPTPAPVPPVPQPDQGNLLNRLYNWGGIAGAPSARDIVNSLAMPGTR
jgi:hypothetical protein